MISNNLPREMEGTTHADDEPVGPAILFDQPTSVMEDHTKGFIERISMNHPGIMDDVLKLAMERELKDLNEKYQTVFGLLYRDFTVSETDRVQAMCLLGEKSAEKHELKLSLMADLDDIKDNLVRLGEENEKMKAILDGKTSGGGKKRKQG